MDELRICLYYVLGCVVFVIICCIKDKTNVFEELYDFFREWWSHAKAGLIFLGILALIGYAIFH